MGTAAARVREPRKRARATGDHEARHDRARGVGGDDTVRLRHEGRRVHREREAPVGGNRHPLLQNMHLAMAATRRLSQGDDDHQGGAVRRKSAAGPTSAISSSTAAITACT